MTGAALTLLLLLCIDPGEPLPRDFDPSLSSSDARIASTVDRVSGPKHETGEGERLRAAPSSLTQNRPSLITGIHGRVVDAISAEPVERYLLRFERQQSSGRENGDEPIEESREKDGEYLATQLERISDDGSFHLQDLPAGIYTLSVDPRGSGYEPATIFGLRVPFEEAIRIPVARGAHIEGLESELGCDRSGTRRRLRHMFKTCSPMRKGGSCSLDLNRAAIESPVVLDYLSPRQSWRSSTAAA
jgi:hypothetical protein